METLAGPRGTRIRRVFDRLQNLPRRSFLAAEDDYSKLVNQTSPSAWL